MHAYDPQNPFAKILRGEFPCYKVHEDDYTLAFLDIMPRCPGHTLVIPKAPARNILDISPDDLARVTRVTQKIAKASMTAFDADGITVQQFSEAAGGQVVFHLHVHVMPRHVGVALLPPASRKEDGKVLEANQPGLRMVGVTSAEQLIGHSIYEFMSPESAALRAQYIAEAVRRSDAVQAEISLQQPGGKSVQVNASSAVRPASL